MEPLVSVIISVYNTEMYLEQNLKSILNQTLSNIEIIYVDDGSTDSSLNILKKYASLDERIHLLQQRHEYSGAARNYGLEESKGEYVIFLDSDDFFSPELLEHTVQAAQRDNADIVIFAGQRYDDKNKKLLEKSEFIHKEFLPDKCPFSWIDVPNYIFSLSNPAPWCKLFSRSFLMSTGLRFQQLQNANDFYFSLMSMALAKRISVVDENLIFYRTNRPASLQFSKYKDPLCHLIAIDCLYQKLVEEDLFESLQTSFRHQALSTITFNLKTTRSDQARIQILDALNNEPYCNLPLNEIPEIDSNNPWVHNYSNKLLSAQLQYQQSLQSYLLMDQFSKLPHQQLSLVQESPIVSIIIPVYNIEQYLDDTLACIVGQTLKNIEIICIDDGSSDQSLSIINKWAANDDRFVVISQPNAGQGYTRNVGINLARGKYLYFMDGDDILELNTLEQLTAIMDDKQLDSIYFDALTFYESSDLGDQFSKYKRNYIRAQSYDGVYDGPTLMRLFEEEQKYLQSPVLQLHRTSFIRDNKIYFSMGIIHEDNVFTFSAMLLAKRVSHTNHPYYHRRIRSDSSMTKMTTFQNVYGYYRAFWEMLWKYNEISFTLSPENRSVAMTRIQLALSFAQKDYSNMSSDYDYSEYGMLENLSIFKTLVESPAVTKNNNQKLNKSNDELKSKLQGVNADSLIYRKRIHELESQILLLKQQKESADYELNATHASFSYRLGHALTRPARWLRNILNK